MTRQTSRMKASLTRSWNKSLIELTNILRGLRHRRGMSSALESSRTAPFQTVRLPDLRVRPAYFDTPIASSRRASSIA